MIDFKLSSFFVAHVSFRINLYLPYLLHHFFMQVLFFCCFFFFAKSWKLRNCLNGTQLKLSSFAWCSQSNLSVITQIWDKKYLIILIWQFISKFYRTKVCFIVWEKYFFDRILNWKMSMILILNDIWVYVDSCRFSNFLFIWSYDTCWYFIQ